MLNKSCRWLDSNVGSLVVEAAVRWQDLPQHVTAHGLNILGTTFQFFTPTPTLMALTGITNAHGPPPQPTTSSGQSLRS